MSRPQFRVVTYNIHKCRGIDRCVRPGRIVDVLARVDADIIALQEVCRSETRNPEADQAQFIARRLGLHFSFGENRRLGAGGYGNVVLTRLPIRSDRNYDITTMDREPRGCLRADVEFGETTLHV